MNPFNPLSIVQSTFESADVQHELKELVEIIRAYDIYDFLRRLSALNTPNKTFKCSTSHAIFVFLMSALILRFVGK